MSDNKHLDDACTLIDALEQYVGKSHDELAGMPPDERGELAASAITESYAVLYAHRYDGIWPETRVYAEGACLPWMSTRISVTKWTTRRSEKTMKRVHGEPINRDVPKDAQETPPVQCEFKVGDIITYTNPQGVVFHGYKVTGFAPKVTSWGAFIYLNWSSWWYPAEPESLKLNAQISRLGKR